MHTLRSEGTPVGSKASSTSGVPFTTALHRCLMPSSSTPSGASSSSCRHRVLGMSLVSPGCL
eukprot:7277859-Prymnesium_polylepis.1